MSVRGKPRVPVARRGLPGSCPSRPRNPRGRFFFPPAIEPPDAGRSGRRSSPRTRKRCHCEASEQATQITASKSGSAPVSNRSGIKIAPRLLAGCAPALGLRLPSGADARMQNSLQIGARGGVGKNASAPIQRDSIVRPSAKTGAPKRCAISCKAGCPGSVNWRAMGIRVRHFYAALAEQLAGG